MQPISQNNPNLYKGPASSADFNRLRNEMHHDLTKLFEIANTHDADIRDNMNLILKENFFLQCKILDLESMVQEVEANTAFRMEDEAKKRLVRSFHTLEGLMDGDAGKEAYINTLHGYASIPPSDSISKITHRASDGRAVTPKSLKVSMFESNNTQPIDEETGDYTYYEVSDADTSRAFDGRRDTYWVRNSRFSADSGVSEVYGTLHIRLPLDTMNDLYANHLSINPFPEYSLSIRDVLVKGHGERWRRLENYPVDQDAEGNEVPVVMENVGKTAFSFPKAEITEIQIKFSQPYWFMNEGRREFTYGFQEIDLSHQIINQTEAEFISAFSLEDTTRRFSNISYPESIPVEGSEADIEDLVTHRLYYNRDLTNEFQFGTEIMAPVQRIYIRTTIRRNGEVVPMVRQLDIDYEYRELDAF